MRHMGMHGFPRRVTDFLKKMSCPLIFPMRSDETTLQHIKNCGFYHPSPGNVSAGHFYTERPSAHVAKCHIYAEMPSAHVAKGGASNFV